MKPDLLYQIALGLIPGVGTLISKSLTEYFGSAERALNATNNSLETISGGRKSLSNALKQNKDLALKRAEQEIKFINKHKINTLFYQDDDYPPRLKSCDDSPYLLYYKGNVNLNPEKVIAIVGSRKCTEYGLRVTTQLIHDLKTLNVLIVSGLAYGIDIEAHRCCLEHNIDTAAVLGHGLDRIYPAAHRNTAEQLLRQGALLTEFITETSPDKENFPKRNRIVAGLCDATIVIESGEKGGSLITADIAHSYSREVFAYPGRSIDKYSAGCNQLLKSQKAILIENAQDLLAQMNWAPSKQQTQLSFADLSEHEERVKNILTTSAFVNIETLAALSKIALLPLKNILFEMEMKNYIKTLPGNRVQWIATQISA